MVEAAPPRSGYGPRRSRGSLNRSGRPHAPGPTSWTRGRPARSRPPPPEAVILRSRPGVGPPVGATLLSEAAARLAARDYRAWRCLGGGAPVTRPSGRSRRVVRRRAPPPTPLDTMQRLYFMPRWFGYSDPAMEEAR